MIEYAYMISRLIFVAFIISLIVTVPPESALADHLAEHDLEVTILDETGQTVTAFGPFDEKYRGDASLAVGDLGTDGTEEIVVGAGHGQEPKIKVYRQDGSLINEFFAYDSALDSGINIALCDLTGDGIKEIITAPKYRGGPQVKVFESDGTAIHSGFFAYSESFRGGVSVACGDLNGDDENEIVTGAGITGGPHIKTFNNAGIQLNETFAGSSTENTGVNIAVGDLNNDGDDEIITARAGISDPTITYFEQKNGKILFVGSLPGPSNYRNGLQVLAADVDGDGEDEIGVATNGHITPTVIFYKMTGAITREIKPDIADSISSIIAAPLHKNGQIYTVYMKSAPLTEDQPDQFIKVDVSEQTLYAYENSALVKSHLVSTGTYTFPTPYDTTTISRKLLWHDYVWSYGVDNPNNYSLPNVQYNVQFRPRMYLHSAYWHNNFGHRMSHGCINQSLVDSGWIYNWANIGATVTVAE